MKRSTFIASALLGLITICGAVHADPQIEMVHVPGGCFQMGDTFGDGESDEKPVHQVCVNEFYIGKYEVTQAQWQAVMGHNPSSFIDDKRPVEQVSWDDAHMFIRKLNARTGKFYRLPTEAEWEYAARSGGKKEKWAGTSDPNQLRDHAWFDANSREKTHVVGTKRPNGLGIYDMSGNVWEWCQDKYCDVWYEECELDNPQGPTSGAARVVRGGSWGFSADFIRNSDRLRNSPDYRYHFNGLRLVLPSGTKRVTGTIQREK